MCCFATFKQQINKLQKQINKDHTNHKPDMENTAYNTLAIANSGLRLKYTITIEMSRIQSNTE